MNPLILTIAAAMLWLLPIEVNAQTAIDSAIAHPDRPSSDRDIDASRKPAEILKFAGLAPGGIVIELGAGGGYTTELAARVVGDDGRVYGQALQPNRVRGNRLSNVVALAPHLLYDLGDVLGQAGLENGQADVVLVFFALHDMYLNSRINKPRLYGTLKNYLKPGGLLVILDNAARPDTGIDDTRRLHRIDEKFVIQELQQAGFELDGTSEALRNADDDPNKPWNSFLSPVKRGFQDRFALRFRKPDGS